MDQTIDKTTVYFVHKDNSPQSYYRIGSQSIAYDATGDFYKCRLMNFPLGEAFNSRLNYSMREIKGYTYGLRASFTGSEEPGPFAIATGVKSNATDSSLVEIMSQIKMYLDSGPTAAEVDFTKKSLLQSEALEYETNAQKTGFLREIAIYNLTPDFKSKQAKIIAAQTPASMKEQAIKFINPDKLNIVVVGDKKHLPALSKLGYRIVELNPEGYYISTVAP
jgi:zinc protease